MSDPRIEKLARAMCEAVDIDPDGSVSHGYGVEFRPTINREQNGGMVPAVLLYTPTWKANFAWEAEKWIYDKTGGELPKKDAE